MLLLPVVVLAGCALRPGPPGSEVRAEVIRRVTPQILALNRPYRSAAERAREDATGLAALAAEGRVVAVRCALSPVEVVGHDAVLAPGMAVAEGAVVRVRLGDAGTPDAVLGPETEVTRGTIAAPGPGEAALVARHYYRIRGVHLLACSPRG